MADQTYITDPSFLTTQQLQREILHQKEFFLSEIESLKAAIKLAHDDMVRVPTEVQKQVGSLKELHEQKFDERAILNDERFAGVQTQFEGQRTALNAAFTAQEKQSDKQAEAFTKQIEGLTNLHNDLKDRVTVIESRGIGAKEVVVDQRASRTDNRGNVALVVSIIALLASLVFTLIRGT